jgi:hypothetical protein
MKDRKSSDIIIACRECGKEFAFTIAEQEFYEQKGWSQPKRCKDCRLGRRNEPQYFICFECGSVLDNTMTVYCSNCHVSSIAGTQLEYELKDRQKDKALEEALASLDSVVNEKRALQETLSQKGQAMDDLKQEVERLNSELKEVRQFHSALDQWLQPALSSLEGKMEEKLESVEQRQNTLFDKLSQLTHRLQEIKEGLQKMSLLDLLKRKLSKQSNESR